MIVAVPVSTYRSSHETFSFDAETEDGIKFSISIDTPYGTSVRYALEKLKGKKIEKISESDDDDCPWALIAGAAVLIGGMALFLFLAIGFSAWGYENFFDDNIAAYYIRTALILLVVVPLIAGIAQARKK